MSSPDLDLERSAMPDHERAERGDPHREETELFDTRMREAELEARAYLDRAKSRADSVVSAMVRAVEHEAESIRHCAEKGIRARWQQVEQDANRHIEEARLVAERMVGERQRRLATLSDGISAKALTLTSGMDDAERLRGEFNSFVRALSATADRVARDQASGSAEQRTSHGNPQSGAIAA